MKIKINNYTWDVKFFHRTNEPYDGQTCESQMIIKVNIDQNPQIIRATLVHELCHAFLDSFGFGTSCKTKFTVEELCEFVAMNNEQINNIANKIMGELNL